MRPPNLNPTETSLGTSHQRDEILGQEAQNSRGARRVRTIARVAFVLMVVGVVAAILVGPGIAIGWVGTYLVPVVVVFGVLVGLWALLAWAVLTLLKSGNKII
jgi:hypothetical protein